MKQINNWEELKADEGFKSVKPGPYIVKIVEVEDVASSEYLKIKFDIAEGELKGEYARQQETFGNWPNQATIYKSYKDSCGQYFKRFITAVEKSNPGYVWDWDERKLVGKLFVANFGEEEDDYNGEFKIKLKVREERSIEAFKNGDIKVPKLKKLKVKEESFEIKEEDLPW